MPRKSDDLWASGRPEPTYKQKLINYLKENSHTYFNPQELAEPVFDLDPIEKAWENIETDFEDQAALNGRMRRSLFVEILLEELVEEGLVEKRSIRMSDILDEMAEEQPEAFEKAREKVEEEFGMDLPDDYRGGDDTRSTTGTWYRINRDRID
jgi:hypothetical protein